MIANGVNLNLADESGNTALILAAKNGELRKTNIKFNEEELYKSVSFHLGIENVAVLLIENGADVNVANQIGETSLMWAAYNGKTINRHLFIRHGTFLGDSSRLFI